MAALFAPKHTVSQLSWHSTVLAATVFYAYCLVCVSSNNLLQKLVCNERINNAYCFKTLV